LQIQHLDCARAHLAGWIVEPASLHRNRLGSPVEIFLLVYLDSEPGRKVGVAIAPLGDNRITGVSLEWCKTQDQ